MATGNRITINEDDIGKLVTLKMDLKNVESLLSYTPTPGTLAPMGAHPVPVSTEIMTFLLTALRDKLREEIAALISAP